MVTLCVNSCLVLHGGMIMKKVIIILLVLAVSLTGLFAATVQLGPSGRFNGDISNIEDYKSISNYEFGAEARVRSFNVCVEAS